MNSNHRHYALTINDHLLSFDEAIRHLQAHGEPERYYCPGCNREVHLSLPTQSFVHNTSRRCDYKSYIRSLAVLMLYDRFKDRAKDFMIGTKRKVLCREYKTCQFYSGGYGCWGTEMRRYDLKKICDSCDYPSGSLDFTADLVLSDSSGKKPPMYIRVHTDFLSSVELPPDILLIEISIPDEESAVDCSREPILEQEGLIRCHFHGPFKRSGGLSSSSLCDSNSRK